MDYMTAEQAAEQVGLTLQGMLYHCRAGNIETITVGSGRRITYLITPAAIAEFQRTRRGRGRPPKKP